MIFKIKPGKFTQETLDEIKKYIKENCEEVKNDRRQEKPD